MSTSFCRRTTVSEFYSGETYRVGSDKVSEAVKILSRIERVRTRNFENKSEGEFYSAFRSVRRVLYTKCTQRTESELKDKEHDERKGTVCLEARLSKV